MSSSFSSNNWVFDVFPSFRGEDIRKTFLSHFLKELDRKLITAFKDNKIERSQCLDPELKQAIRDSRIAIVVFSKNYASSSWCLNELLEILKCKDELGQLVIPIFYGLDPSQIRYQGGDFGKVFENTCKKRTEDEIKLWRQALADVSNLAGFHMQTWDDEANMIEEIANDVLGKLNLTPSRDFKEYVGIEDHIAKMSLLLNLESKEVRMVGIWGTTGIGKTIIARALFSRLCRQFQGSVFIDKAFISKSKKIYNACNPDDYNMKLQLQEDFLSKIFGEKYIKIDHLGVIEDRLKNKKVLIVIDDLDDHVVLDTLAGQTHWFGCGSRIIVITKDMHFLRAHGISHIYEVCLPPPAVALQILCRYAFKKEFPPEGLRELATEVAFCAGNLPLGLHVMGFFFRGRDKEDWINILPRLRNDLDGRIEKTLKVSYDGLNNKKDEAIFRHIACLFNGEKISDIKQLLLDSDLDVGIGFKNLVDKSLIHVKEGIVEMHRLLQEMGKLIVRTQSNEPGEREFLMDSKDICNVLDNNPDTTMVLGISLNIDETDELYIKDTAFNGMCNLLFLKFYTKRKKEIKWHLSEGFDYLPPKLRLLRLDGYPMRRLPSQFCHKSLVKLQMRESNLEKLWEGVHSLTGLKTVDMYGSKNLKEIPNLSMATNLEKLNLGSCSSLVELPSSIQYLNNLKKLDMPFCKNLETLPTGINLQSLYRLNLNGCSRLMSFPHISTNILELDVEGTSIAEFPSNLRLENLVTLSMCQMKSEKLWERVQVQPLTPLMTMLSPSLRMLSLSDIPSLGELPSSFHKLDKLTHLSITRCINLETLPNGINLQYLYCLDLSGCSKLRSFPSISTNISQLFLCETAITEVPWWIEKFSRLYCLRMNGCSNLRCVSLNISKLKHLEIVDFSYCGLLVGASCNDSPSVVALTTDNIHSDSKLLKEASSSFGDNYFPKSEVDFIIGFDLDQELLFNKKLS